MRVQRVGMKRLAVGCAIRQLVRGVSRTRRIVRLGAPLGMVLLPLLTSGAAAAGPPRYDDLPGVAPSFAIISSWDHTNLTYGFVNGTADIAGDGERQAVRDALALWSTATPLTFTEVSAASAEIRISWATGDHGDGYPFDGVNNVLAHAFPPPDGDTHFDDAETWTTSTRSGWAQPIDLVTVAAHEFGHALGLGHSADSNALMYEFYLGSHRFLAADDIQGIAQAYGFMSTQATLQLGETLNGQPGYQSVSGTVTAGGGAPSNGTQINVNFQKLVNGQWQTMSSAHPPVTNGSYSVNYWGVSVGQWRVRTVVPAQRNLLRAESPYSNFQIKSGYRLVARHSRKCLSLSQNRSENGTAILQWDCSPNPSPGDGQVLTLVPYGNGDFNLKINSTGKCVDVTGVSTADGAYLQQWDCLGAGQTNQLWRVIPIAGQPPYVAFQAKHSGKCADVLGQGTGNGVRIGQWSCWWGGNQQWSFQAID